MSKRKPDKRREFDVAYCIEQGFSLRVRATSADDAERAVHRRLAQACDVLPDSKRIHYAGFVVSAAEVTP